MDPKEKGKRSGIWCKIKTVFKQLHRLDVQKHADLMSTLHMILFIFLEGEIV